jgi:hypothetical protein
VEKEMMDKIAGVFALLHATMMMAKSIALEESRTVVRVEGTVHIRMGIALQYATRIAIMMKASNGAIMAWMIMDVGWVTIAQWNAPWFALQ